MDLVVVLEPSGQLGEHCLSVWAIMNVDVVAFEGHVAEPVYGAAEALERAAAIDPEIVLLDIGLPDMDGYEVARLLRSRGSSARLVALTG
jgi:CheY-like chemotaxis protein